MNCPDDNALAELALGLVSDDSRRETEDHVDGCRECRQLIAELAKLSIVEGSGRTGPGGQDVADPEPESELEAGAQLARYTVLRKIGAGGMGVVYAAHDPDLDRTVAIKLLKLLPQHTLASRARLRKEARAMAKLAHPNVVTVYEVGEWNDRDFVAMEYVDGDDIAQWLARASRPWREVLDVFLAAGRGLAAAHAAGIIHRDIKPGNLILGGDGRVRVTDFGLARAGGPTTGDTAVATVALTATDHLAGTPAYMAPEQLGGHQVDARADQFSFCVSLYQGLYGVRPFAGLSPPELANRISSGEVHNPAGDDPVPSAIRCAVLRGLSADPQARYDSMNDLMAALDAPPEREREHGVSRLVLTVLAVLAAGLVAAAGVWLANAAGRSLGSSEQAAVSADASPASPLGTLTAPAALDAGLALATMDAVHAVDARDAGAARRNKTRATGLDQRRAPATRSSSPATGQSAAATPAKRSVRDAGTSRAGSGKVKRSSGPDVVSRYQARQAVGRRMKSQLLKLSPAIARVLPAPGAQRTPCYTWAPTIYFAKGTDVGEQRKLTRKIAAIVIRAQNCMPPARHRKARGSLAAFTGDGWLPEVARIDYALHGGEVRVQLREVGPSGETSKVCCKRAETIGKIRKLRFVSNR